MPDVGALVEVVGFEVLPGAVVVAGTVQPAARLHSKEAAQTSAPSCCPFFIFSVLLIDWYMNSDGESAHQTGTLNALGKVLLHSNIHADQRQGNDQTSRRENGLAEQFDIRAHGLANHALHSIV